MLALNEDNSHFYSFHTEEEMTAVGLDAWVDQYADTQVEELILCPNSQRSSVASAVRQTVWDGFDPSADNHQPFFKGVPDQALWPDGPNARQLMRNWVYHAWLLDRRGLDPYARWIARCRTCGIRPWISMRMNDVHYVDQPDHCIHDRFWKEHPEYRRTPPSVDGYNGQCLDYGIPEVYGYQLSYARELIARYDMDGFELDWMRNPYHLKPGREKEGCAVLTEFVAAVRSLLGRRAREVGHPIQLGVRVPSRPETALGLGMDVQTWARRRLVDKVSASSFLYIEFDLPVPRWKTLLEGTGVRLAGIVDAALVPYPGCVATETNLEMVRAAAATFLERGVDQVYLFNHMDNTPVGCHGQRYKASNEGQAYRRLLREGGALETLAGRSRRHIVTVPDTFAPGEPGNSTLPMSCLADGHAAFDIATGPAPVSGQQIQVRLASEPAGPDASTRCNVDVNGTTCRAIGPIPLPQGCSSPLYAYAVPISALRRGGNKIYIHNSRPADIRLTYMEIAFSQADGQWPASGPETAAV